MITINGTEFRNLEEQVLKNKQDIANHYNIDRVLADFGIKVVGKVSAVSDLPDESTYDGDYGDAYAVGVAPPYTFYIWTRPDPNSGEDEAHWMSIGELAIQGEPGPAGPAGATGPEGKRGTQWFIGTTIPSATLGQYRDGDAYLQSTTGDVYHLHINSTTGQYEWRLEASIKGPQGATGARGNTGETGPQGPRGLQGPAGPAGPIVDILGTLTSVDQLPDPTTVSRQAAYLLQNGEVYNVYIIIGEEGQLEWYNAGLFATGTQVYVDGVPVQTFNYTGTPPSSGGGSGLPSIDSATQTLANRYGKAMLVHTSGADGVWKACFKKNPNDEAWAAVPVSSFENTPPLRDEYGHINCPMLNENEEGMWEPGLYNATTVPVIGFFASSNVGVPEYTTAFYCSYDFGNVDAYSNPVKYGQGTSGSVTSTSTFRLTIQDALVTHEPFESAYDLFITNGQGVALNASLDVAIGSQTTHVKPDYCAVFFDEEYGGPGLMVNFTVGGNSYGSIIHAGVVDEMLMNAQVYRFGDARVPLYVEGIT